MTDQTNERNCDHPEIEYAPNGTDAAYLCQSCGAAFNHYGVEIDADAEPEDSQERTRVRVEADDGRTEELVITRVSEYVQEFEDSSSFDVGDEAWILEGLQPRETELIPSEFVWLSGGPAQPNDDSTTNFPLVQVPKNSGFRVTVLEECDEQ